MILRKRQSMGRNVNNVNELQRMARIIAKKYVLKTKMKTRDDYKNNKFIYRNCTKKLLLFIYLIVLIQIFYIIFKYI
jgi:hypothetical protein